MIKILNDTHLGATRKAGTTPESQAALRTFMFEAFEAHLEGDHDTLIILGDLFDAFTVDPQTLIFAHQALTRWLRLSPYHHLVLVCGNHDWSPKGDKVSSFHILAHFMKSSDLDAVTIIDYKDGLTMIKPKLWVIPHMANQDLFNMEVDKAAGIDGGGILLLHTNFENNFADHSDHSLNVYEEQTDALVDAGWTLVFAHEHQGRKARDGRVVVIGNQIPSSVADCLGNDKKYYATIDNVPAVGVDPQLTLHEVLEVSDYLTEVDWRDLEDVDPSAKFVRVTGEAASAEASAVVDAIWRVRQKHEAFVISNAVKIEGMGDMDALAEASFEDMKRVDVLDLLLQEFNAEEKKAIKELLA